MRVVGSDWLAIQLGILQPDCLTYHVRQQELPEMPLQECRYFARVARRLNAHQRQPDDVQARVHPGAHRLDRLEDLGQRA